MITRDLLQEHMNALGKDDGLIATYDDQTYGIVTNYDHDDRFFHWVLTLIPDPEEPKGYRQLLFKAVSQYGYDEMDISVRSYKYGESVTLFDTHAPVRPEQYPKEMEAAAELIRLYKEGDYWPSKKRDMDHAIEILNSENKERWAYIKQKEVEFKGVDLDDDRDTEHRPLLVAKSYQKNTDNYVLKELIETVERLSQTHGISEGMHRYLTYSNTTLKERKEEMK